MPQVILSSRSIKMEQFGVTSFCFCVIPSLYSLFGEFVGQERINCCEFSFVGQDQRTNKRTNKKPIHQGSTEEIPPQVVSAVAGLQRRQFQTRELKTRTTRPPEPKPTAKTENSTRLSRHKVVRKSGSVNWCFLEPIPYLMLQSGACTVVFCCADHQCFMVFICNQSATSQVVSMLHCNTATLLFQEAKLQPLYKRQCGRSVFVPSECLYICYAIIIKTIHLVGRWR